MLFAIVMLLIGPQVGARAPGPASAMPAMPAMPGMGPSAACPAKPAPLPPELAGWRRMTPLAAGATPGAAPPLAIGTGVRAALLPTRR